MYISEEWRGDMTQRGKSPNLEFGHKIPLRLGPDKELDGFVD